MWLSILMPSTRNSRCEASPPPRPPPLRPGRKFGERRLAGSQVAGRLGALDEPPESRCQLAALLTGHGLHRPMQIASSDHLDPAQQQVRPCGARWMSTQRRSSRSRRRETSAFASSRSRTRVIVVGDRPTAWPSLPAGCGPCRSRRNTESWVSVIPASCQSCAWIGSDSATASR